MVTSILSGSVRYCRSAVATAVIAVTPVSIAGAGQLGVSCARSMAANKNVQRKAAILTDRLLV
jgi:hypothetical protein